MKVSKEHEPSVMSWLTGFRHYRKCWQKCHNCSESWKPEHRKIYMAIDNKKAYFVCEPCKIEHFKNLKDE